MIYDKSETASEFDNDDVMATPKLEVKTVIVDAIQYSTVQYNTIRQSWRLKQ